MSQEIGDVGRGGFDMPSQERNQPPKGFARYWEAGEYRELMQQLESFMASVLETDQIPFDVRYQYGREQVVRKPVGNSKYRSLVGFLPLCGQWMDLYWAGYAYSADMQLFFDCFMQHRYARLFSQGAMMGHVDRVTAATLYNEFVSYLRAEAADRGVKKKLADARSNLRDQERSIETYLGELTSQYKSLVPIRVDLAYEECGFEGNDAMPRMSWAVADGGVWMPVLSSVLIIEERLETRARIDTAQAMQDRDCYFGNQRGADKHLFDRVVGFICKMEQGGRHRAIHFHCIFLIDARGVTQADLSALKRGLDNRWHRVTRGQGLMFDSHERADREAIKARGQWAIDPVNCSNPVDVATFISYVVWYFAKDDKQMVRVKPTAKARTLTMGRLPG